MEYLHIKNIEKYHLDYKDRELKWCKIYFNMLNGDPEFEMVDEVNKWRFICFVMLELQAKKPIPLDEKYLMRKGFDFKLCSISKTLQMLQNFTEISEEPLRKCNVEEEVKNKKLREEVKNKNKIYVDWEQSTITAWNSFCDKHPLLTKVREVSEGRRAKLKKRYESTSFQEFSKILEAVKEQSFLMGENDRKWKITFDWLIDNGTNFLKVLERRYASKTQSEFKAASPDCKFCQGTGWVIADGGKRLCGCRQNKQSS